MLQQNLIHQHRSVGLVTNIAEFCLPFNKSACSFLSIYFDQLALSWNMHACMQKIYYNQTVSISKFCFYQKIFTVNIFFSILEDMC